MGCKCGQQFVGDGYTSVNVNHFSDALVDFTVFAETLSTCDMLCVHAQRLFGRIVSNSGFAGSSVCHVHPRSFVIKWHIKPDGLSKLFLRVMRDPDDEWSHAPGSNFDEWRKLYRCWFTLDEKQAMERRRLQQQEHDARLLNKLHEAGVHFILWHKSLEAGVHFILCQHKFGIVHVVLMLGLDLFEFKTSIFQNSLIPPAFERVGQVRRMSQAS